MRCTGQVTIVCRGCGGEMVVGRERIGRRPLYCSEACRRATWAVPVEERPELHCLGCGAVLPRRHGPASKRTRWCSEACRRDTNRLAGGKVTSRCRRCERTFEYTAIGGQVRVICPGCQRPGRGLVPPIALQKPQVLWCENCGGRFEMDPAVKRPSRRFCTAKCEQLARARRALHQRRQRPVICAGCHQAFARGPEHSPPLCCSLACEQVVAGRLGRSLRLVGGERLGAVDRDAVILSVLDDLDGAVKAVKAVPVWRERRLAGLLLACQRAHAALEPLVGRQVRGHRFPSTIRATCHDPRQLLLDDMEIIRQGLRLATGRGAARYPRLVGALIAVDGMRAICRMEIGCLRQGLRPAA
jgi:hypothetical protein